ncbi:glyceraldehyde 3-phosphate dehydrogenase [Symbiobacterium terraclitae]|uniref:Glyceraldehyde-3-phosphate dehydrogenase n=1 Tax=Symbiobacterium terraclitae TaxID=557451 RepID=A0ABS4JTI8_9FIRM|nr:glyceraldehyde 3-phosphate dehydrogenase [Symbiobacterium terraclitae]
MKAKVAINGFGRIGRMVCRRLLTHPDLDVAAINASYDARTLAHLLKYDTVHGRLDAQVTAGDGEILVDGRPIRLVAQRDAALLPWEELGIDIVIEATGKYKERERAALHLQAGARKVIITTATKDPDVTIVMGVNADAYCTDRHHVIAAASCTTNCLAPVAKVLHEAFGIESGLMTTVHAYTNDQNMLDNPHRDLRRARSATASIIPTTTGAARAVAQVLPELKGRLNGFALRVPTPDVSVVDLVARLARPAAREEINQALREASEGPLRGILAYTEEELVSVDFVGNDHSAIVDGSLTMVGPDNVAKVVAWYDNEWGYSCRVVDLAAMVARQLSAARPEQVAAD